MVQEVVHNGEDTTIVRRSCHNHLIHTESILDSLGHIVAAKVCNRDLLCALLAQNLGHHIGYGSRTTVNRCVGDKYSLGLNIVLAPRIIEADVISQILLQDRAVQRADALHVERCELLQQRLHGAAILSADIEVITACLASPILLVAQSAELTKAIGREDNLIFLIVCHHHLGPMHHRRHKELQDVLTQTERIALLNGNGVL